MRIILDNTMKQTLTESLAFPPFRPASPALAAAVATLLFAAPAVQAQSGSDPNAAPTLNTVVVTASGREQQIKEAPASISVITREELDKRPYTSVREVLADLEGVAVVGGSNNETDITIRGLPGEYTLILVDGKRQSTRETMNRGTGGVQSSLVPPLAAIERIEVVRGPMSSLYGADAMGGVVNIITRKVPRQWGGSVEVGGVWQSDSRLGDTSLAEFWIGGPIKDDVVGLTLQGKTRNRREDSVYYPLNATAGTYGQKEEELSAKLTVKPTANQDLSFELGTGSLELSSTPGKTAPATVAATTVLRTEHERRNWAITHNGRWDFGTSTVALYQEVGEQTQWRPAGQSPVVPELTNTVLDGLLNLPLGRNLLKIGGQYSRNELTGIAAQDAAPGGYGANVNTVSLSGYALFAENEFFATDRFTLTTGLRLDDDERYGKNWTPRVYGVYQVDPRWTLRGGVAKGFKAPTIRQSTEGYCMTTGGAGGAVPGTLCGDDDLKAETSTSGEIGLRFDEAGKSFSVTLFNNQFKNKVASYDTGVADARSPGRNIYVYDNIDRVTLRGIELGAQAPLNKQWKVSGHYTFTDSRRKGGGEPAFDGSSLEGRPLDKTPEHMLNAQLDWQPSAQLNLYGRAIYTGKQYWAAFRNAALGVRERPATTTFDLGGSYAINRTFTLKFAVLNLTDKVVETDARGRTGGLDGNWMVDEGRRLAVSLNAQF
jgi:outer membrane receptor for ferrienterochelin and colicins